METDKTRLCALTMVPLARITSLLYPVCCADRADSKPAMPSKVDKQGQPAYPAVGRARLVPIEESLLGVSDASRHTLRDRQRKPQRGCRLDCRRRAEKLWPWQQQRPASPQRTFRHPGSESVLRCSVTHKLTQGEGRIGRMQPVHREICFFSVGSLN